ncbi:hypothetical protein WJX73_003186 [Symbiochloris irregularis]|uniref:Uncharacterized protein n=1 Tax=Symbiochloris irregularis TaxID=706552 RepID=A0AAW1PMT4_9CHLO
MLSALLWAVTGVISLQVASASESFSVAELFTNGDFNLSSTSIVFSPSDSASGGYTTCQKFFSLRDIGEESQYTTLNPTNGVAIVDLGAAKFPFRLLRRYLFVNQAGFLSFDGSTANLSGSCLTPAGFFSGERVFGFCTGDTSLPAQEVQYGVTASGVTVIWVSNWSTCPTTPPPGFNPNPPPGETPVSSGAPAFPAVVVAQLQYSGVITLSTSLAHPCSASVGISKGSVPAQSTPLAFAPVCNSATAPPPSGTGAGAAAPLPESLGPTAAPSMGVPAAGPESLPLTTTGPAPGT